MTTDPPSSAVPDMADRAGVRSSFWDFTSLATSNIILIPMTLGVSILAARILGTEGYGRFGLFGMVAGLFLLFTSNWNLAAVLRFGREEYDQTGILRRTFWARNVLLLPALAVGAIVACAARQELTTYLGLPEWTCWLVVASFLISAGSSYIVYLLQSAHHLKGYAAVQGLRAAAFLAGLALIYFGFFDPTCPNVILAGLLATLLASGGMALVLLRGRLFRPVAIDRPMLREIFLFSYPVILGNLAAYFVDWMDMIVIKHYSGFAIAGGYQLALNVYNLFNNWAGSISILMTPMLISFLALQRQDLIRHYVGRLVPQGLLLMAVAAGVGMGLFPLVFGAIYGMNFRASGCYFQILAFGLAFSGALQFNTGVLTAYKVVKLNMVICVVRALVNLGGDLWLVPWLGPTGAAISNATGVAVAAISYLLICQWLLKMPVFWQAALVVPALLALVVSLVAPPLWGIVLAPALAMLSGYGLAKGLGLFRREDSAFLDSVHMPARLRGIIVRLYGFLGPRVAS